jgi:hypothetical protein
MVFNIATAALIISDYNQNYPNKYITTYTEYVLSIVQLVFVSLTIINIYNLSMKINVRISISLVIIKIYNFVYSAFVINNYLHNMSLDSDIIVNMSIAIIVLNIIALCGCVTINNMSDDIQINSGMWLSQV